MTPAITIFSDFASAYSYLAEFSLRSVMPGAPIRYRAVASPGAPTVGSGEDWEQLVTISAGEGIELRLPPTLPRTDKAHEAALFARDQGREDTLRVAIFAAFWRDGADIGRIDVLCDIAESVGLDRDALKIALDIDLHSDAISYDAQLARRLGIRETPVTYLGTGPAARVITGAYTTYQLRAMLQESETLTQAGDHG